ncbi:malto-oligosyltrehalose trehalohydrolase [Flaviaesturariibacter flavus]|uniref:Malto-oligosyltrehalose trehalohydrolase n=1 Tax=Flaviaesturariibacter flavus TaxID=2502780 RepID=A0A4R1BPK5_9BACT|nr:malto-oligosyltrehalose trehalohydrolase [Flaviaesturariibacter flavus]TCJ19155.1 malto-oligosyltrehalose trehalohydrolase [Flaviaesturariibacter flavus]
MQDINTSQRTLGAVAQPDGSVELRVWAPLAGTVSAVIGQKEWPLRKEAFGYWTLGEALAPGSRYKVRVDGGDALPDPASLSQPDGVHGDSEVVDPMAFTWADAGWQNHDLSDYIIYELHTGTFTPEGDFAGIEKKLDHLLDLGVNAIEIMPVAQFPGGRNWGYDGVFSFAVQNTYGGAAGLQRLVDACHRRGIAVALDVVYNHLGPEGNYLGAFGPYLTDKYSTPWGGAINFDDAWSDGVRRYFIENALMWLRDFHIDALRLDAVHAIKDFGPVHFLQELREHLDRLMADTGRTHYLIVECDLNDTRFIDPPETRGYGMHSQWIDEFHHALRVSATGERTGYYSDFAGIEHLAKAYRDAYVYDGQWSEHRKKHFGVPARANGGEQFIVFTQNHDQVGNRMLGESTSVLVSFEMQKLMAGAVLFSPFLPMLWMGEEWSEPSPFLYFVSHGDADLCAAVREGRRREFAAFHAQGEAPDPVASESFENSRLRWELRDQEPHATMLRFYKKLIRLRRTVPALANRDREGLTATADPATDTLVLQRQGAGGVALVVMNFSKVARHIELPVVESAWTPLLQSSAAEWGGSGDGLQPSLGGETVELQPESFILYTSDDV